MLIVILSIREYIHAVLKDDPNYQSRPFDLRGMCLCIAVKVGGGEICHTDFPDSEGTYGIGLPLGDFEGAGVAFPQTKAIFPVAASQVILFNARLTAHFMEKVLSGHRAVITGFTCRQVAAFVCRALQGGGYKCTTLNYA